MSALLMLHKRSNQETKTFEKWLPQELGIFLYYKKQWFVSCKGSDQKRKEAANQYHGTIQV